MSYYKKNNEIYYYDDWQEVPEDMVELTPQELEAHLNPISTEEEIAEQIRAERDSKIEAIEWRLSRYERQQVINHPTDDSQEWYEAALIYIQALRDVPQQEGFPSDVVWPVLEEGFNE